MSELLVKFVPPVDAYFTATFDRGAALDLITTLTAAGTLLDVPASIGTVDPEGGFTPGPLLAALIDEYDGDLPGKGIAIGDIDGDAAAA